MNSRTKLMGVVENLERDAAALEIINDPTREVYITTHGNEMIGLIIINLRGGYRLHSVDLCRA